MDIVWGVLFGALVGWIGSLAMRTGTSEGIVIDIAVGALGALGLVLLLGNRSTFDNLAAGYVGAALALVLLFIVRSRPRSAQRSG